MLSWNWRPRAPPTRFCRQIAVIVFWSAPKLICMFSLYRVFVFKAARAICKCIVAKILASSWLWLKRVCDTASMLFCVCIFSLCVCERWLALFPTERVFSSRRRRAFIHVCAAHRMFYHHFFNIAFGMSQIRPRPYICHPPPRFFPHVNLFLRSATFYFAGVKRERWEKEVRLYNDSERHLRNTPRGGAN